jgi:hypothetical protein
MSSTTPEPGRNRRTRPSFRAFSRNGKIVAEIVYIEERDPSTPDPAYPCAPGCPWCDAYHGRTAKVS